MGFSPFRALSTTVLGSVPRVDTRGRLEASCHAHRRAPSHRGCIPRSGLRRLSSRAQDPSTRGVYRTPRITVRRRPSSQSVSRTLACASRQPRPTPCRVFFGRSVLPVPPLRRHPAPPCPSRPSPPEGGDGRWTSKTLFRRTVHQSHPSRGRLATEPLAESGLVAHSPPFGSFGVDPGAAGFRHPHRLCDPLLREEQVRGGPPCRQVGQLSWDSVPCRRGSKVRASERCWLIRASGHPYTRFASGETSRHRDAVRPRPPTTCAVEDTVCHSPEPDELSPAGVSLESIVSVTELGTAPRSTGALRFASWPLQRLWIAPLWSAVRSPAPDRLS